MLQLKYSVPDALLLGQAAIRFAQHLQEQNAHWFNLCPEGLDFSSVDEASVTWLQSCTSDLRADSAKPNEGNSRYASGDGPKGLVFEQGINCGFEMTLPKGAGADYSFAIRFNAPTGNARTLLTLNPNKVDNYLFVQQAGGTINFKDQQNTLELMASLPSSDDATNLLVVGQSNGALNMRVEKEDVIVTETRVDLGLNGPSKLFVGCRSNRGGLYKTLGSFVMKDIIFWPEHNILEPKHSETLNMLDEYSMWED
jgi:hypothetical protein